jgi:uncharacterized protein (DUF1330 family)
MSDESTVRAYVVNQVEVRDPVAYAEYAQAGRLAVVQHGGRILAGGGLVETLEGEPIPSRVVIIEFPNREAAIGYYESSEYQAAKALRGSAATVRLAIVDGIADPSRSV